MQEGAEGIPFGPVRRGGPQRGRGPDQELGLDVPRRVDDVAGGTDLDQLALVEHGDPVRDAGSFGKARMRSRLMDTATNSSPVRAAAAPTSAAANVCQGAAE